MVIKNLPAEIIEALRKVDSPTVSNAIEAFKVRDATAGYASMELRCHFPEQEPMVGYAVTCSADSTSPAPARPNRICELLDAIHAAPKPAVVVIQHVGPDRLRSCFVGDMLCSSFQKLGVVGVVTDGGVRDLSGVQRRAPGFQVFSPGVVVSHGVPAFLEIGITVSICGLTIQPGDLLHGNESGLLTVPLEIAASVVEQARIVLDNEQSFSDLLGSDLFSIDALKRRLTH
jgi:regulator of RNase E activity RraA